MAWGRRCDLGCESWPDAQKYAKCPGCGEKTTRFSNLKPLSGEAASYAEFELYYAVHDAARDPQRLDGDAANAAGPFARFKRPMADPQKQLVQKVASPPG